MAISPTAEGFRAAFRRPSVTLAEIMWRWTAGATAAALFVFGLFEYLNTLPVTNGELLFLRTRHPYLVGEAIAHILRGSLNRVVIAGLFGGVDAGSAVDRRCVCGADRHGARVAGVFPSRRCWERFCGRHSG